jgi:hypothetical protein
MYRIIKYLIIPFVILLITGLGCQSKESEEQQSPTIDRTNMSSELSYQVPESWQEEKPSSSMRKAQYRVPGVDGAEDGEMAVFVFPGSGGGVQANIDRWIGQFTQPDGSNSRDKTEIKKMESDGLQTTLIYLTGNYVQGSMMGGPTKELKNYAMFAAIVETSTDPWFFKTVGPQATIDHWRAEFEKFIGSIKQH